MVDFIQLQDIIRKQLVIDRNTKTVTAKGPTLEAAVEQAATLLSVPVRRLEYEIAERGTPGILGTGKKDWTINAYERATVKANDVEDEESEENEVAAPVIEDLSGDAFVNLRYGDVYLKVIPPKGRGKRISEQDTLKKIQDRYVTDINNEMVSRVVQDARGEYVKIGSYQRLTTNDSTVVVDVAEGEMKAFITVSPPGMGGSDISVESFLGTLRSNKVVYGVNEDAIREFADRPIYKEKIAVAEGTKPINGKDSHVKYNFETDQSRLKLKEGSNGRIDFKDINIIQNVVENQPLAVKIEAEQGISGRTVTGKIIPARDGRDLPMPLGKNVHMGNDEMTIIADINGQVIISGGKINVEPVYTVQGDVNLKTGNIIFLGTVIINGNVEDGFSVKATGNIEINGTVEKAELDAEGDIIVHQGITGKSGGSVKTGRSLWARFIENATVEAGNMVVVSDGIINSQVDAFKRIICQGKRAHIVGGRLRASEEINAKILGSPTSGTSTICEVGIDPKSKEQMETLTVNKEAMEKKIDDIQRNLQTLINIKKQRKTLPEDKENYMQDLMDQRQTLMTDLKKTKEEMMKIQDFFNTIKTRGKVSASSKVYPGVKITVREASLDVNTEYRAVTFILEDNLIRVTKYEEPDEEAKQAPEGYATN
ncbi:MAG: FapA family protein [Treponema sp.]|jgi:uncharacterized protein (DUF342 family)|nr:FapA family protein [Treponema sp.]